MTERAIALMVLALLAGCGAWEQASVTVAYGPPPERGGADIGLANRERVETAFTGFYESNGYLCRRHMKRVGEYACRGPMDLHLTFAPQLNKTEFLARFSWVNSGERNHTKFVSYVSQFRKEMAAAIGEGSVADAQWAK